MFNSKDNILIFIHIPKTAGSTFHMILNSRYSPAKMQNLFGSRYTEPEIAAFMAAESDAKTQLRLLKGHMPYGMHRYVPLDSQYISVLRDPVERVISQYYYIKKNTHNPLHDRVEKSGMSISDFVTSGIAIGMNNGQCRFLNGDIDEFVFGNTDTSLLDNVIRNIEERFIWLGITERFDESILLLAKSMSWKKAPHYIRENVSKIRKAREEIAQAEIDVIREFNQLDIKLYDWANKRIDQQIAQYSDFNFQLEGFQKKNAIIQRRWSWLPDSFKRFVL